MFGSFSRRPPDTVTGYVHMYGSMPFAFPGIETEDGRLYTLVLDKKRSGDLTLGALQSLQGQRITLAGQLHTGRKDAASGINRLRDGEFVVWSYAVCVPGQ